MYSEITVTSALEIGITDNEIATTIKSKNSNAYGVLTSKYLLAMRAKIVVPAVVPPASTIIPIPSPTGFNLPAFGKL